MSMWMDDDATRDLDDTAVDEVETRRVSTDEATRELPPPAPTWILHVRQGPEKGRRIEVPAARSSLGRSGRCAIRIEDPSISRVHLWVEGRLEGVLFHEESTKNGTTLDGAPCIEGLARKGQRIGIGQSLLEVRAADEAEARTPGIVEQAFRLLRGEKPERRSVPIRRVWPLPFCTAIAITGVALALLRPAPAREPIEELVSEERAARLAFDRGLGFVKLEAFEQARPHFERAADVDPSSEEPARYLRWLDEREALGELESETDEEEPLEEDEAEGGEDREHLAEAPESPVESPRSVGPPRRPAPRRVVRNAAPKEEAREMVQDLLDRAAGEEGSTAVATLREAWEKGKGMRVEEALLRAVRERLAERSFAVGEDALLLGRLPRAATHFRIALEARPDHGPARQRLESLRARAESFLIEGYSLRERDPVRAREWLELVLALTEIRDPLHQRAQKWLAATPGL